MARATAGSSHFRPPGDTVIHSIPDLQPATWPTNAATNMCAPTVQNATPCTTALTGQSQSQTNIREHQSLKLHGLPTPVKPDRLEHYLKGYNKELTDYLLQGFTRGFTIHAENFTKPVISAKNATIALKHPCAVSSKLQKELKECHIAGPYDLPPLPQFHVSPLSLRPKPDNSGWRLLHDLSFPYNDESVNQSIPDNYKSVKYSTISNAIDIIQKLGPNTFMAKSDIQSAFTIVPVHPSDYHMLGFQWQGKYYYYTTLPQGAASSCFIFERIATALHWILSDKYQHYTVVHYLDDFLFLHTTPEGCEHMLNTFHLLCNDIGIPINHNKTEGPTTCLSFLGIQLDSANNQATLPLEKVNRYNSLMQELLHKKSCKLHEIQKIIGCLQFTTSVVSPGRVFLRRLINSTIGVTKPYHHIHITREMKEDLCMWLHFLQNYNGVTIFIPKQPISSPDLNLYTDSCPQGFGGTYKCHYFMGIFPNSWKEYNIAVLELYPIMLALQLFAWDMSNKHVILHTDNHAVSDVLSSKTSKHPQLTALLRTIVLHCLNFNIKITSKHISGKTNVLPDALSRNNHTSVMLQAAHMEQHPTLIPTALLPENYKW